MLACKHLEDFAFTPCLPLDGQVRLSASTAWCAAPFFCERVLPSNGDVDCCVEDFVNAGHFFRGAFHVHGAHLLRNLLALLLCDRCQALGFEELDAGAFMSEVGLQAAEDYGCCRTKVQDFRVPLLPVS